MTRKSKLITPERRRPLLEQADIIARLVEELRRLRRVCVEEDIDFDAAVTCAKSPS